MQNKTFSKIFGLLFAASCLRAETTITEAQFLAAIGDDHPAAIAVRMPLGRAQSELVKTRILDNPSLLFDREQPDEEPRETVWSVAWRPPLDGRYGLTIDSAEEGLEVVGNHVAAELLKLRLKTRRVFASWLLAEGRYSLLKKHSEKLSDLAARMSRRAEVGEESRLDARRFELAATVVATELGQAKAALIAARAAAFLWNPEIPPDSRAVLVDLPAIPDSLESSSRPDLMAKRDALEKSEIENRLSRRFWSFPELYAGWKSIRDSDLDLDHAGPVFGFNWQFPLFDRRQADRQQVVVELEATRADLDWSTHRATAELGVALQTYEALRSTAERVRSVADKSDEVLLMGGAAFAEGEYTTTDLLEIWGTVVVTHLEILKLEFEALAAHREIEAATGETLPLGGQS